MYTDLSYAEYIKNSGESDSREAWTNWKVYACGMDRKEAVIASIDPEWGWEPGMI